MSQGDKVANLRPMSKIPQVNGVDSVEHWTLEHVCAFFGGKDKPLNPSTIYRGIKEGRYPAPVKVGPQISRWLSTECEEARARMMAERRAEFDTASERMQLNRKRAARKKEAA
jgi:predicted DNA-binding transcriptional regulator AlpA